MKFFLKWLGRGIGLYLILLVAYFLYIFATMNFSQLAFYDRKLNPSTFAFWQGGELYSNPPLFSQVMSDPKGLLSSRAIDRFDDVEIWVLLLDGFEDIRNVTFAHEIISDFEEVLATEPGETLILKSVALIGRRHPLPFYVRRRYVLVVDATDLRERYRQQCLDEMIYDLMIDGSDKPLWDRCKKT